LEAKIAKERGKWFERTVGYDKDEDLLRWEFGSDTELDELGRLAAAWIQEDTVSASRSENMGRIQEHWLVQRSSENLGIRNHRFKKPIERIGRMVLSPLADRVYICNKIKLDYPC